MCVYLIFLLYLLSFTRSKFRPIHWQTAYMSTNVTTLNVDKHIWWVRALLIEPDEWCCVLYSSGLHPWRLNRFVNFLEIWQTQITDVADQVYGWLQGRRSGLMSMHSLSLTKHGTSNYAHNAENWLVLLYTFSLSSMKLKDAQNSSQIKQSLSRLKPIQIIIIFPLMVNFNIFL
jgi:hypothetical protein